MKALILHQELDAAADAADEDVVQQAAAVSAALRRLGHRTSVFQCSLDLQTLRDRLIADPPDLVVNLVESLSGTDRLMHLVPALLEALEIPFTGSAAAAIALTTDKLRSKARMRETGLPTPPWHAVGASGPRAVFDMQSCPFLIKAVYEHASFGMDDSCWVHAASPEELEDHVRRVANHWGRPCFAEAYIDGREFNLSLLQRGDQPEVLPCAEIEFRDFGEGKPRIVGYNAKWKEDTFEYHSTPRRFDFPPRDAELLEQLRQLAVAAWRIFDLRGYARVDFRVDAAGRPWILEVNANPCLSPDAGFAAALERAGISYDEAMARIVASARQSAVGNSLSYHCKK